MKKIIIYFFLICSFSRLSAQDSIPPIIKDTSWKVSGFFGVNASQTSLSNWQGGGQSNISLGSIFNTEITYVSKDEIIWNSKIDAQYGVIRQGDGAGPRKNNDLLFALTKLSKHAFGKYWYYSVQADYRTQFAPGYNYDADSISGRAVSDINSPGYIQLAMGLDYTPADYFSVKFAPVAAKVTIVNRQYLADEGAFGVNPAIRDSTGQVIVNGSKVRYEFGARIIVKFKKDILPNFNLDSYLDLFTNYSENPGNVDVIFNNLITYKINKLFTFSVISQMIYDDDIIIKRDWDKDGKYDSPEDINGPRPQFLTTVAFGVGYKF